MKGAVLFPVALREARQAARSRSLYIWRMVVAGVGLLLIPAVLLSNSGRASQGPPVFMVLSTLAFVYAVFGGVMRTADSLSEEKRENTLGLLFLTDLKASDVISGKLLASSATIFFGLLAILPLLAIPILMGGVSSHQLLQVSLNLVNTLFLSISWGLLISTCFRQAWTTMLLSLLVMLFINLGVVQLANWFFANAGSDTPMQIFFLFSPLIGHIMSIRQDTPVGTIVFWQSLAVNHFMAWLNIGLTAYLLPAAWKELPRGKRAEAWWRRLQWLRFGGSQTRSRFRTRLLNTNPLFWLSGREQVSSGGLMAVLLLIAFFSFVNEWTGIIIGLVLMHSILLVRMASAASHALAEDRKSGALELLLATSLSVNEVLRGRWMALGRQFTGPILIVSIWHFFSMAWVSMVAPGEMRNILLLWGIPAALLAWFATGWCGMWLGLRARNPTAAVWWTVLAVVIAPWILSLVLIGIAPFFGLGPSQAWTSSGWTSGPPNMFFGLPGPSIFQNTQLLGSGFFLWSLYLWWLAFWSARKIRARFREAATDRFTDTQPYDWTPARRMFIRVGAAVVAILVLINGWRMLTNFRGERAYRSALAAYPNFSLQPELPFYPARENLGRWEFFADINSEFTRFVLRPGQRVSLHQLVMYGFNDDDVLNNWTSSDLMRIKGRPTSTSKELAAAFLKRYQNFEPELARLREAARTRPYLQLPLSPGHSTMRFAAMAAGAGGSGDALQGLIQFTGRMSAARVAVGERPIEDVLLTVRFATSLTNHPGELNKFGEMLSLSIQPIFDGIQLHRWTDADLQAIQGAFSHIDFFQSYDAWREQITRDLLAGKPMEVASFAPGMIGAFQTGGVMINVETDSPGAMKLMQANLIHYLLGELRGGANSETRQVSMDATARRQRAGVYLEAVRQAASQAINTVAVGQTAVDQVIVACALERYRLAKGKYPRALADLIPTYLAKIPDDVVMAKPPVYRPDEPNDGYKLYSLGFDRHDDEGTPSRQSPGDWAWIVRRRDP